MTTVNRSVGIQERLKGKICKQDKDDLQIIYKQIKKPGDQLEGSKMEQSGQLT